MLVRSPEERAEAVRSIDGGGAVVEELVDGPQWIVHCAYGPELFVGAAARVRRRYPRGVGTPSVIEAGAPGGAPAVRAARRLLDEVDYAGIANLQFFERAGEMLVHDVNLRPAASLGMVMRFGLDLPRLGVAAALGRPEAVGARSAGPFVYVAADRELAALRDPDDGESAAGIALGLVRAAASPRTVLDPPLRDVLWAAGIAGRGARRVVRSARRAAEDALARRPAA